MCHRVWMDSLALRVASPLSSSDGYGGGCVGRTYWRLRLPMRRLRGPVGLASEWLRGSGRRGAHSDDTWGVGGLGVEATATCPSSSPPVVLPRRRPRTSYCHRRVPRRPRGTQVVEVVAR